MGDEVEPKAVAWEETEREEVFKKYGRSIDKVLFQLPSGEIKDFYIQNEKSTVCVLPVTRGGEVVLIEQYRPGPKEVLMELPGGYMDVGEKPLEAIKRELLEETGYTGSFVLLNNVFHSAYSTRVKYLFVATQCEVVSERTLDESEQGSRMVLLSMEDFLKNLYSGKLTDADCSYAGLQYLKTLST